MLFVGCYFPRAPNGSFFSTLSWANFKHSLKMRDIVSPLTHTTPASFVVIGSFALVCTLYSWSLTLVYELCICVFLSLSSGHSICVYLRVHISSKETVHFLYLPCFLPQFSLLLVHFLSKFYFSSTIFSFTAAVKDRELLYWRICISLLYIIISKLVS